LEQSRFRGNIFRQARNYFAKDQLSSPLYVAKNNADGFRHTWLRPLRAAACAAQPWRASLD